MESLDKFRAKLIVIILSGSLISAAYLWYRFDITGEGDYFSFSKAATTLSQATLPLLTIMVISLFSGERLDIAITSGQKAVALIIICTYSFLTVAGSFFDFYYLDLRLLPWVVSIQTFAATPIAYIFGRAVINVKKA